MLPDVAHLVPELSSLTDINISKNNLFNTEAVFNLITKITSLKRINLSENFINGVLPVNFSVRNE